MSAAGAEAAAAAVLSAARAELGSGVELAGHPRVSVRDGRGAYTCALAAEPPAPWDGHLVVRVHPEPVSGQAAVAREVAWHALGAAHGLGVPAVLSPSGDRRQAATGSAAVVIARGRQRSLLECMVEDPEVRPWVARLMGELHARLHGLPADGAPEGDDQGPLDDLGRLLAASGLAGGHLAAALDGLRRDERGGGTPVVCHGQFQPSAVRLDPDDPTGTVVANWSVARLCEREYDVALTMLVFWSMPYVARGRGQRGALVVVRDALMDGYRSAYERHAPLDDDRLRFWGAFHALSWSARMAATDGMPSADPWDPSAVVTFRAAYRKDLTRRFATLTRGVDARG